MSEVFCGENHSNIDDAIAHTYELLVGGQRHLLPEPYWGTRGGNIGNVGKVIGWKSADDRVRWRLDHDPEKGVHINTEDFNKGTKIVHPIAVSLLWASTYWNKWTSAHDKPQYVVEAEAEILRRRREGFR